MDTRNKILTQEEAVETAHRLQRKGTTVRLVTGHFDPLLAEHARRLGRFRREAGALMVVVSSPDSPLLPARARAELLAGLAVVDYVVLPEEGAVEGLLGSLEAAEVIRQEASDERLTRDLIRHVRSRQPAS